MPDEPAAPAMSPLTTRTTEQILHDIEALLLEIRALLKRDIGSGGLGH